MLRSTCVFSALLLGHALAKLTCNLCFAPDLDPKVPGLCNITQPTCEGDYCVDECTTYNGKQHCSRSCMDLLTTKQTVEKGIRCQGTDAGEEQHSVCVCGDSDDCLGDHFQQIDFGSQPVECQAGIKGKTTQCRGQFCTYQASGTPNFFGCEVANLSLINFKSYKNGAEFAVPSGFVGCFGTDKDYTFDTGVDGTCSCTGSNCNTKTYPYKLKADTRPSVECLYGTKGGSMDTCVGLYCFLTISDGTNRPTETEYGCSYYTGDYEPQLGCEHRYEHDQFGNKIRTTQCLCPTHKCNAYLKKAIDEVEHPTVLPTTPHLWTNPPTTPKSHESSTKSASTAFLNVMIILVSALVSLIQ